MGVGLCMAYVYGNYVIITNQLSTAAVMSLFCKCQKCLTLSLRSVLDVRNVFHILDFQLFIIQMPFTFILSLFFFQKLLSLGFIHSKFSELIRRVKFFKKIKIALGFMNIVLLDSNRRHVLVIHVAILRVLRTRIQRTHYNFICIPLFVTLKMATWVAKTCRRLLCNKIAFIHRRVYVALFKKFSKSFVHSFVVSSGCQNALKCVRWLSMSRTL
jgi:hypothetical protein